MPRIENFGNSSNENDISAGACRCGFTVYFDRHVAFPNERIAFSLGEARVTQVKPREGKGSPALIF